MAPVLDVSGGGAFLVRSLNPEDLFTPEDLSGGSATPRSAGGGIGFSAMSSARYAFGDRRLPPEGGSDQTQQPASP